MCGTRLAAVLIISGWLTACASVDTAPLFSGPAAEQAPEARFEWLRYEGDDPVYRTLTPGDNDYLNPVLAGFYPDPSITRAGADYYLVNSTFCYFPGIPVFKSSDLVHWAQIGNVIDRSGMLDCTGLGLSRGVFAPAIRYHNGLFYLANTCVDCGGNYIVTAADPAGPWSDPVWMPAVSGLDPSLFFDADGRLYLVNSDAPLGKPRYDGHRAIWLREIDAKTFQPVSKAVVLVDGGVHPEENPIWIEGPHIYRRGDWYYLIAAEGGTAEGHSEVVFRARHVHGPYQAFSGNPILTQRRLSSDRADPVTSTGHADLVEDQKGRWWAVFLGVRPYEGDYYNTGRETFLLPVEWKKGWPIILKNGLTVPYIAPRPNLPSGAPMETPKNGNFTLEDSFDGDKLAPFWLSLRDAARKWARLEKGALYLCARRNGLGDGGAPSFIAIRQQHQFATATTLMEFAPGQAGDEAGLAALQSDDFFYALGVTHNASGQPIVLLRKKAGAGAPVVLASASIGAQGPVYLRITARGAVYDFSYALKEGEWKILAKGVDGKILSTRIAGGFVGAVFGLYAERSD